jgi:hypothetical protein
MKRDWDLIREQLLIIEEGSDPRTVAAALFKDIPAAAPNWEDGQTEAEYTAALALHRRNEERVGGHLELLLESGYIEGITLTRYLSGDLGYAVAYPRLTMAGHDLLDTMRSKPLWESVKTTAKAKSIELTFDSIKALAAFALKSLLS